MRKVQKTLSLQSAISEEKISKICQKSNLICITSRQIHIPNYKSISQKTGEKSLENKILAKGNNSFKSRSNATKVKLDLYHVKTNVKYKSQIPNLKSISQETTEKSSENRVDGQQVDWQTDWRTDGRMDRRTEWQVRKSIVPPPPVWPVGD